MPRPNELNDLLAALLAEQEVSLEAFQSAVNRLYSQGVVALDFSESEDLDYRTCRVLESTLLAYFNMTGWAFIIAPDCNEYRLYPPGAQIAGEEEHDQGCSMRYTLPREASRIAIACHLLYDQALKSGDVDEQSREVLVRLEDIGTVLASRLGGELPKVATELKRLLDTLRQCRYLRFSSTLDLVPAAVIGIRPSLYQATTRLAQQWLAPQPAPVVAGDSDGGEID